MASDPRSFQPQGARRQAGLACAELASFGRRSGAFAVDLLVVGLLLAAAGWWLNRGQGTGSQAVAISFEVGGLLSLALTVAYFGVATFVGRGRTPGKRLFGIRVVSLHHDHLSLWHCIERALGYSASSLEAGFGFLQQIKHPNAQTVHDRIAETIVIRERAGRARRA